MSLPCLTPFQCSWLCGISANLPTWPTMTDQAPPHRSSLISNHLPPDFGASAPGSTLSVPLTQPHLHLCTCCSSLHPKGLASLSWSITSSHRPSLTTPPSVYILPLENLSMKQISDPRNIPKHKWKYQTNMVNTTFQASKTKDAVFNKWWWDKLRLYQEKRKFDLNHTPYTKINYWWEKKH